jgi:hypothetical protein
METGTVAHSRLASTAILAYPIGFAAGIPKMLNFSNPYRVTSYAEFQGNSSCHRGFFIAFGYKERILDVVRVIDD